MSEGGPRSLVLEHDFVRRVCSFSGYALTSAAAGGRCRGHQQILDEPSELRHGRENGAARATYNVSVILRDVRIDNRLRGAVRAGEFFSHGTSEQTPAHLWPPVADRSDHSDNQREQTKVPLAACWMAAVIGFRRAASGILGDARVTLVVSPYCAHRDASAGNRATPSASSSGRGATTGGAVVTPAPCAGVRSEGRSPSPSQRR